jgi:hypothetical protein
VAWQSVTVKFDSLKLAMFFVLKLAHGAYTFGMRHEGVAAGEIEGAGGIAPQYCA